MVKFICKLCLVILALPSLARMVEVPQLTSVLFGGGCASTTNQLCRDHLNPLDTSLQAAPVADDDDDDCSSVATLWMLQICHQILHEFYMIHGIHCIHAMNVRLQRFRSEQEQRVEVR